MGARVCVTGHWRARGGKAAQSGESVTEWLLVAHTVRVLTAAPSVHGVRSVLDAARRGTMSAPAAAAALVYAADAEGSEAAAAEGSEGGEGVAMERRGAEYHALAMQLSELSVQLCESEGRPGLEALDMDARLSLVWSAVQDRQKAFDEEWLVIVTGQRR